MFALRNMTAFGGKVIRRRGARERGSGGAGELGSGGARERGSWGAELSAFLLIFKKYNLNIKDVKYC